MKKSEVPFHHDIVAKLSKLREVVEKVLNGRHLFNSSQTLKKFNRWSADRLHDSIADHVARSPRKKRTPLDTRKGRSCFPAA